MTTLGERLAQNIAAEAKAASDAAAALSQQRTAEAQRKFRIAKTFFDDAKQYFIDGITSGAPVASLFRQVGGKRYSRVEETHETFGEVLEGYQHKSPEQGPDSLHDPKRLAPLWHDFRQWADSEGLEAKWHYCWDGGGMDSWWQLRVAPKTA